MSVAEAWVHPSSRAMRYVRSDELHQIFNFDFLIAPWESEFLVSAINKTLSEVGHVGASPTWVLSNHDSPRLVTRLGGGQLGRQRARAMALLTHGLPGGIYIYQGEELGLEDGDLEDKDRQDPVFLEPKVLIKDEMALAFQFLGVLNYQIMDSRLQNLGCQFQVLGKINALKPK